MGAPPPPFLGSCPSLGVQKTCGRRRVQADTDFLVEEKELARAVGLVKGDVDPGVFFDADTLRHIADTFAGQSNQWMAQRRSSEAFASREDAPFPAKPDLRDKLVV
jgi:hypothetical protein